ncbi:MAG: hypothetical protein HY908_13480 [Myxococcales bacterium]|nr:hypothetical protein [Myxococcales bacterium]
MHRLGLVLIGTLAVAACSKSPSQGSPTGSSAPSATAEDSRAHAAKDVAPGSHEDWCEEHGVPESQCTRCDPSLAAAFKATNDWCKEHGLPESQCTKCNPGLEIVRPAKRP